ncbi:MAG: thioesterase family protein [Alcanivoracaceae bacterium]|nr:thioesterase family protein [Alcanivoracaceae bacterium]
MSLNHIIASLNSDGHVDVPGGWTQGRALFGGLLAALMCRALEQKVGQNLPLRSATINFIAPASNGPLLCQAEIFRQGKSVTQGECRAIQNGKVVAVLLASFGVARESVININECSAPVFSTPEESIKLPFIEGVTPEFIQYYDFRWAHGGLPYSRSAKADIGGWVRELGARDRVDYTDLLALVDSWPPAVLPMLSTPAPASSMTWTVEFMPKAVSGSGQQWWQYLAETEFAAEGYVHSRARLWDESGKLVAISRQTVTVFA